MSDEVEDMTDSGSQTRPTGRGATVSLATLQLDPVVPARVVSDSELALAVSEVTEAGLLRPLLVRPADQPDTYYVFSGALMLEAMRQLDVDAVPVEIFDDVTADQALWLATSEQQGRSDWSPIRQARVVHRLTTKRDGTIDEAAVARCQVLFAGARKNRLSRRRILQHRQVGEVFTQAETARRQASPAQLAKLSGRELVRLSQQPDPWAELLKLLEGNSGSERATETPGRVRVTRQRDGRRQILLPTEAPEEWDPESVRRFLDEVGPVYTRLVSTQSHDAGLETTPAAAVDPRAAVQEIVRERDELLRRVNFFTTELAAARGVIASLHASRAVQERRRADALERAKAEDTKPRRRWVNRLWPLARKRVSSSRETSFRVGNGKQ